MHAGSQGYGPAGTDSETPAVQAYDYGAAIDPAVEAGAAQMQDSKEFLGPGTPYPSAASDPTFFLRATRFRLRAGCLSWEKKDGTAAKNQRTLDVIPAQYEDPTVISTKSWRDLNKAEMKPVKAGAIKKPQLDPKEKRAAQAEEDQVSEEDHAGDSIEEVHPIYQRDLMWSEERAPSPRLWGSANNQTTAQLSICPGRINNLHHVAGRTARAMRSLLRPR